VTRGAHEFREAASGPEDFAMVQYIAGGLLIIAVVLSVDDAFGDNAPLIIECDAASNIVTAKKEANKPIEVTKSFAKRHVRFEFVGNGQVVIHYDGSNNPVLRNVATTNGRYEIIEPDGQQPEYLYEYIDRIQGIYHFESLWTLVNYATAKGEGPCSEVKDNDTPKF
jgi:hypothetical protein